MEIIIGVLDTRTYAAQRDKAGKDRDKKRRCEMREYNFQRDLVDGKAKVEVGQCLMNRKLGRLRVIRAGDPYMVDGDSDDDAGRSGGGFRAGRRFMRQDYVCVQEGD